MSIEWKRMIGVLLGMLLCAAALAQTRVQKDLTSLLQSEVNEIAALTAQSNYLQQQNDPLGAAALASYIPDHRLQASLISATLTQTGANPTTVAPTGTPLLGTRMQILDRDRADHQKAIDAYRRFANNNRNNTQLQAVALNGLGGAWRHFQSIDVARGATQNTPNSLRDSLLAAWNLEQFTIADLQTQANQLTALGDANTAAMLTGMIPAHQQQAANLQTQFTGMGGSMPRNINIPTPVAIGVRDQILTHFLIANTQMVNTYALPISVATPGPLRDTLIAAQTVNVNALASLQQLFPSTTTATGTAACPPSGTVAGTTTTLPAAGATNTPETGPTTTPGTTNY